MPCIKIDSGINVTDETMEHKRSGSSNAPWKLCSVRKRSANVAAATKRTAGMEINHTL